MIIRWDDIIPDHPDPWTIQGESKYSLVGVPTFAVGSPPMGNPGSATADCEIIKYLWL